MKGKERKGKLLKWLLASTEPMEGGALDCDGDSEVSYCSPFHDHGVVCAVVLRCLKII